MKRITPQGGGGYYDGWSLYVPGMGVKQHVDPSGLPGGVVIGGIVVGGEIVGPIGMGVVSDVALGGAIGVGVMGASALAGQMYNNAMTTGVSGLSTPSGFPIYVGGAGEPPGWPRRRDGDRDGGKNDDDGGGGRRKICKLIISVPPGASAPRKNDSCCFYCIYQCTGGSTIGGGGNIGRYSPGACAPQYEDVVKGYFYPDDCEKAKKAGVSDLPTEGYY